jgi:hypothetical protein
MSCVIKHIAKMSFLDIFSIHDCIKKDRVYRITKLLDTKL